MEYNTHREQLKITDYGRNVCKMIEQAKKIEDREKRTQTARAIVEVMAQVNPKSKERSDFRHTLWDHLMLMANYELDVDCPYPIHRQEENKVEPHPLHYNGNKIHYRHYGKALEDMITTVAAMPEGKERELLTEQIAHTMKRQYLQWNRDSVDDSLIVEQLRELSDGRLTLPEEFRFKDTSVYVEAMQAAAAKREQGSKKKKRKKKKQQQNN